MYKNGHTAPQGGNQSEGFNPCFNGSMYKNDDYYAQRYSNEKEFQSLF